MSYLKTYQYHDYYYLDKLSIYYHNFLSHYIEFEDRCLQLDLYQLLLCKLDLCIALLHQKWLLPYNPGDRRTTTFIKGSDAAA